MARQWTEGFEFGDMLFWSSGTGMAIDSSQKRTGVYSTYLWTGTITKNFVTAVSEFYFRGAVRINGFNANSRFPEWRTGGTVLGSIRIDTNGYMQAYVGTGTYVGGGSTRLYTGTWYSFELYVKIADASGRVQIKIDGITEINYTGDTKPGADTTANAIAYVVGASNWYIDDLALNDTTGAEDNSWCGDGRLILIKPNANGDSSAWVGSDGNSTDNYALVDDIPASAGDYVEASASGDTDLYNLAATGLTNMTILRIWPEARAVDTVAAGGQIYLPIKAGSTQVDGTAVSLLTTYTKQLLGDVRTINPDDSAAWEIADIDALQAGVKVV